MGAADAGDWRAHCVPTPYHRLFSALAHAGVGRDDVFVDLGCGLGRAVFVARRLGAGRAVGVEIDPALVQQAQANLRRAQRRGGIDFICAAAQEYDFSATTVLFMFHPFGEDTMAQVVHRLAAAHRDAPRDLRVVYENPVHARVLDAQPWLQRVDLWPESPGRRHRYATMFWRARAA